MIAEAAGQLLQDSVSRRMTIGVVDNLKMVDINSEHRQAVAAPLGPGHLRIHMAVELAQIV